MKQNIVRYLHIAHRNLYFGWHAYAQLRHVLHLANPCLSPSTGISMPPNKKSLRRPIRSCVWIALLVCSATGAAFASIEGTAHDLSASGYGKGNTCSFCHTPHGILDNTPLWNHQLSEAVYQIYQSSSLQAEVGQPTGASKLCLSCHDGTVALGSKVRGGTGKSYISPGKGNLGTDLSDDHPISFVYSANLAVEDRQLRSPGVLPEQLRLDESGELQCTTCHDPHDNQFGDFLVMPNEESRMCTSCHDLKGWNTASHQSSTASIRSTGDPYLQSSAYDTVRAMACGSCHRSHSAGGHERLLHYAAEEDNCLNCHNGQVAQTNLVQDFLKFSAHDVKGYEEIHDPKESAVTMSRHVECVDCHNPHAADDSTGEAPIVSGVLKGVTGITSSGSATTEARYEYEVCFKCHADNPDRVPSEITRQVTQTNTRLEFDPTNPSYHPVISAGTNPRVPSLLPEYTPASIIKCIDCHSSDPSSSAKGPHGSHYPPLLAYRYETIDGTQESPAAYELCYRCHSRNSILNDESFKEHKEHIEKGATCSACHDPHGISSSQGSAQNHSHLINFDISIVGPDPKTGRLEFEDLGTFRGRCYLTCHGENHSPEEYPKHDDF
jgi:predicted CXXCH cytochrome family protein